MIGVTHATRAIDAIQRMIGRVELGVIPQVVDTVIFIDAGKITKVYELRFTVKVPHGMFEADLARPVIEVVDFETKRVEYEIYTYGEQVVVMPVEGEEADYTIVANAVENKIKDYLSLYEIEALGERKVVVRVPEDEIPHLLGRKGRRIHKIEEELGIRIEVQPLREEILGERREASVDETGKHYIIYADGLQGRQVNVYAENEYLFTASVGRKGVIRVKKDSENGKALRLALMKGNTIYIHY
jgi:ATPase